MLFCKYLPVPANYPNLSGFSNNQSQSQNILYLSPHFSFQSSDYYFEECSYIIASTIVFYQVSQPEYPRTLPLLPYASK